MTRNLTHRFKRGVECISVLLITLFANTATAADAPYNLIIIQTDEHHFGTLGPYGGDIVGTTHIDWLAKNGVTCTSFYATTPVCSPSRAALVSGMYPQKTPVTNNNVPLADSVVTFAHSLQKESGIVEGVETLQGSSRCWRPCRAECDSVQNP